MGSDFLFPSRCRAGRAAGAARGTEHQLVPFRRNAMASEDDKLAAILAAHEKAHGPLSVPEVTPPNSTLGTVPPSAATESPRKAYQGVELVSQHREMRQEELQRRLETQVCLPPARADVEITPFRPEKDSDIAKDDEPPTETEEEILQRFLDEEAAKGCAGRFHVAAFHVGDHFLKAHPPASPHPYSLAKQPTSTHPRLDPPPHAPAPAPAPSH